MFRRSRKCGRDAGTSGTLRIAKDSSCIQLSIEKERCPYQVPTVSLMSLQSLCPYHKHIGC
jgi:hypothetical protein